MNPIVYLAGPIAGCTFDEAVDWRLGAAARLEHFGVRCLSPMRAKDALRGTQIGRDFHEYASNGPFFTSRGIMERDSTDVRRCDAMLVNLLGTTTLTTGTVMELGWAWWERIPRIVAVEEIGNVHDRHPMVHEAIGGLRFPTLDAAVHAVVITLGAQHGRARP